MPDGQKIGQAYGPISPTLVNATLLFFFGLSGPSSDTEAALDTETIDSDSDSAPIELEIAIVTFVLSLSPSPEVAGFTGLGVGSFLFLGTDEVVVRGTE